jgi:hypothetical protein
LQHGARAAVEPRKLRSRLKRIPALSLGVARRRRSSAKSSDIHAHTRDDTRTAGGALRAVRKKAPGKIWDFTEGLDPQIFFREEKNSQVPVAIIIAAAMFFCALPNIARHCHIAAVIQLKNQAVLTARKGRPEASDRPVMRQVKSYMR